MNTPTVIVVGNTCVDHFLPTGHWPAPGERQQVILADKQLAPGGNGFSVSLGLKRLGGADVHLLCGIGHDGDNARRIRKHSAGSLKIHDLANGAGQHVSVAFARPCDGDVSFLNIVGATESISPERLLPKFDEILNEVPSPDFLVLVGFGVMPCLDENTGKLEPALAEFKRRGTRIAVDLNLMAGESSSRWKAILNPLLSHADYFAPNFAEARQALGRKPYRSNAKPGDLEVVEEALEVGSMLVREFGVRGAVSVKCDRLGCVVTEGIGSGEPLTSSRQEHLSVTPIDTPIDPTGAGDSWVAGFVHHLLVIRDHRWASIIEAGHAANAVAEKCISHHGSTTWTGYEPTSL